MAVDYYSLIKDMLTRVEAEIATTLGYTVIYENTQNAIPSDALWIRAVTRPGETIQASLGESPRYRTTGILIFQIFGDIEKGQKTALEAATAVASKFRHITIDNTLYRSPSVEIIGRDRNFWQVNVSCPFQHDDFI